MAGMEAGAGSAELAAGSLGGPSLLSGTFPQLRTRVPCVVMEHRLPRGAVESPSLEIFKPRLDAVLCSLRWVTLLGQGVGLGDPQRSLPTPDTL